MTKQLTPVSQVATKIKPYTPEPTLLFYFFERDINSIVFSASKASLEPLATALGRQIRSTRRLTEAVFFKALWVLLRKGIDIGFLDSPIDEFLEYSLDSMIDKTTELILDLEILAEYTPEEPQLDRLAKPLFQLEKELSLVYTEVLDKLDATAELV